jgi:cell division protein ZapA
MKDKSTLSEIAVFVAGRKYPLLVEAQEEETIRDLVKTINTEIEELHARYASKLSKQDILAMLLLTYAKKLTDTHAELDTFHQWLARLDEI